MVFSGHTYYETFKGFVFFCDSEGDLKGKFCLLTDLGSVAESDFERVGGERERAAWVFDPADYRSKVRPILREHCGHDERRSESEIDSPDLHALEEIERDPKQLSLKRIARNSVLPLLPGSPDTSGLRPVVDPQVPEQDRELLRRSDPPRLAHVRNTPLRRLRRPRLRAPALLRMDNETRRAAARDWNIAFAAGPACSIFSILPIGVMLMAPDGMLLPEAWLMCTAVVIGWLVAAGTTARFALHTGARLHPALDPADAAAHRHPGRFLLPEDLGPDGRALVAKVDELHQRVVGSHRIDGQGALVEEHLWRIAEGAAVHRQAQKQGIDEQQALDESWAALEKHARELEAYVDRTLAETPVVEEIDAEQDTTDTARELRARIAGTEASIDELTGPEQQA